LPLRGTINYSRDHCNRCRSCTYCRSVFRQLHCPSCLHLCHRVYRGAGPNNNHIYSHKHFDTDSDGDFRGHHGYDHQHFKSNPDRDCHLHHFDHYASYTSSHDRNPRWRNIPSGIRHFLRWLCFYQPTQTPGHHCAWGQPGTCCMSFAVCWTSKLRRSPL
jgi:hypothetical protein